MAIITDSGIVGTSLNEYKVLLETAFKNALGADLDVSSQTPQGQLIGIIALNLSDTDDSIVQAFQQLDIFNAAGNQLDAYGATFEIVREGAQSSIVIATVTGVAASIIPAGSQARTTNGDLFAATGNIVIDGSGSGSGEFASVETGAIAIDANTLTQVVSVVSGWETIDNPAAGTVGQEAETDLTYREKYFEELNKNALSTTDAINANIRVLEGVEDSKVFENDTAANIVLQGVTLLPHSIAVIVNGGTAQEIGQTIYDTKTLGANTEGGNTGIQTAVTVDTNEGVVQTTIWYYPVEFVTVAIDITIQQYVVVPDVIDQIKEAIIAFFAGTLNATDEPINIAVPSYLSRLYTPINTIEGFDVLSLSQEIEGSGVPQTVITPDLNQQLIVTETSIGVTIV